ncbi:terminase large subunit [Ochrobactrum sp. SD129]|nr:terminase large subunit [Ochrobactrum sp. SD129]
MMASTYPDWVFDNSPIDDPLGYGERAVRFLRMLRHPSSSEPKKAFTLTRWQERIVRRIYGPRTPDGHMIVKTVLLLMPRGNRKTTLAAALALLHTIGPEAVAGGQAIFAAKDSDQAKIAFEEAAGVIREDKRLVAATKIYGSKTGKRLIDCPMKKSRLEVLSSDGGKAHGLSPTFILADELHVWKNRELWEALKSSRVKKRPLTVIASTAGQGNENLLYDEYVNACKIASGEKFNPSYLPILFMADPSDQWDEPATWHKANPGLADGFVSVEEFENLVTDARDRPQERFAFLQFNLNRWQGASREPLFSMDAYDSSHDRQFKLSDLESLPCYLGVDMSVNGDLTAVVGAWKHTDGRVFMHPWFFIPGDDLKGRSAQDGVPYEQWKAEGHINVLDGPIIEPEAIEQHIRELCATYDVREIAFDPYLARKTMQRLHDDGLPAIEMRQSPLTMAPAIGDLERTVNGRMIRHRAHPVIRHHFDSVVASRGDSGLVRMHKDRRTDRIDGAVAAAMAVSRACQSDTNKSIYDQDEDEFDRLMAEAA